MNQQNSIPGLILLFVSLILAGCAGGLRHFEIANDNGGRFPTNYRSEPTEQWVEEQSSPVAALIPVDDSQILVATHRGEIYGIDLTTGARTTNMWQVFRGGISAVCVDKAEEIIYLGSRRDKKLLAYNLRSNQVLWEQPLNGILEGVIAGKQYLIVHEQGNTLKMLNKTDGNIHRKVSLKSRVRSPILDTGTGVLILTEDLRLAAYSYALVREWEMVMESEGHPYLAGTLTPLWIEPESGLIHRIDTLGTLFPIAISHPHPVYGKIKDGDSMLIIPYADGTVAGIDPDEGTERWRFNGPRGLLNMSPQVVHDTAIIPYARGYIVSLDLASGEEIWRIKTEYPLEHVIVTPRGFLAADTKRRIMLFH